MDDSSTCNLLPMMSYWIFLRYILIPVRAHGTTSQRFPLLYHHFVSSLPHWALYSSIWGASKVKEHGWLFGHSTFPVFVPATFSCLQTYISLSVYFNPTPIDGLALYILSHIECQIYRTMSQSLDYTNVSPATTVIALQQTLPRLRSKQCHCASRGDKELRVDRARILHWPSSQLSHRISSKSC